VFVGGASPPHFLVRVAQRALRHDQLPSFWSLVGIAESNTRMLTVPLATGDDPSIVPLTNGVQRTSFEEYDDPQAFPNLAVIRFAEPADATVENVWRLATQRSAIDLPAMILPWLGYVWGTGATIPLMNQVGLPSAALVETAYGMSGIEVTPGLASGSSCPEAIWQAALWWHDYYRQTADVTGAAVANDRTRSTARSDSPRAIVPRGEYWVRQPAAAATFEPTYGRPKRASRRAR
jgi:hypothetical protein